MPTLYAFPTVYKYSRRRCGCIPPAYAITRSPLHDVNIDGYTLRKGKDIALVSPYDLYIVARIYFPEPEKFDPEHASHRKNEKKLARYAYMPFGAGPRVCIRNHFAMMEKVTHLHYALRRLRNGFEFELVPGQIIEARPH